VLKDNSAITGDAATYPGTDGHVHYAEGVFVGYRHHDTRGIAPLFPFGFGLGYTDFRWGEAKFSAQEMGPEGITVSIDIQNIGSRTGSELVQLYVRSPKTKVERPDKELRAFVKLTIHAGETGTATLKIMPRDLAYYDVEARAFRAEPGTYEIVLATNASDIRSATQVESPYQYLMPPSL
jgi:beta-glucosidase